MTRGVIARPDLVALILAATCWGLGTVVSKRALDEIPPLTLLPVQLAVSLVILFVLMRRRGMSLRSDSPRLLGRLGILNPGIAYALSLLGLTTISVSLSVLLWVLEPLMILILAAVFLRERITPALAGLSVVALVGMVMVVYDPSSEGQMIGVALTMAGVACCAVYTVVTRRWLPAATETGQVVFAQQAHALAFTAIVLVAIGLVGGTVGPTSLTPIGVASAVVSGALYYAGAYWFYLGALRNVPASLAAVSFYLIPIVGIAAGMLVLGERLDPMQWVGVAIVLTAVVAIFRLRSDPAPEATPTIAVNATARPTARP
jgi:probable blue pigment (indigoidine) exporter